MGYRWRRTRKAPKLTQAQIQERYEWCLRNLNNDFKNTVFVDETKVQNNVCYLYSSRTPDTNPE
jgi:hypothetical protein